MTGARPRPRFALAALFGAATLALGSPAGAQSGDVRLLQRPVDYTDVVDAADEGDAFDIDVRVAFRQHLERAEILQERPSLTGAGEDDVVAEYTRTRNELVLGVDLGLYRDLALSADLPLVLSDDRRLRAPSVGGVRGDLLGGLAPGPVFDSPTRSGIDTLSVALAWAPMNQYRSPEAPTWVLRASLELSIGDLLRACDGSQTGCGVSDGTHAFDVSTRMSHRFRFAEPYGGAGVTLRWAGRADQLLATHGDLPGYRVIRPPSSAHFTAGIALIPWENRGRHQRLTFDLRMNGAWVSAGRTFSPLFDALGTSMDPTLTAPNCEGVPRAGTDDCTAGSSGLQLVPFLGVTDAQAHGRLGGRIAIDLQAASFIRFGLGAALLYTTPHFLSGTPRCNPDSRSSGADDPRAAGCGSLRFDPHHRAILDTPGQRFSVRGHLRLSLFASARAQF